MSAAESDDLLAEATELAEAARAFKPELLALLSEISDDTCGGLIAEGVCTKPFRHEGECGLEIEGSACPGAVDHDGPCREVPEVSDFCSDCGYPLREHTWLEVPDSDAYPGGVGDFICPGAA